MSKIVILGATLNYNNKGCNALAYGTINALYKKYGISELTIIDNGTPSREKTIEMKIDDNKIIINMKSINRYEFYNAFMDTLLFKIFNSTKNEVVKEISNADIVYDLNWGDGYTDLYGLKRFLGCFIGQYVAIMLGKRLIQLPQTFGPFNSLLSKILSFFTLKFSKKVFVRDKMAIDYLKKIGIKYEETFDMSVYMQPEKVDIDIPQDAIGLNISGLLHFKTDLTDCSAFECYDKLIEKLIEKLLGNGRHIVLIPHTYNAIEPEYADDLKACKYFANKFNSDNITVVDKDYSAPQLKYIISQMSFFIGSRMHANFAALSTSTPVIGLAYSYKFKGGFEMFNIPECVISAKGIQNTEIESVIQQILDKIDNKDTIKSKLLEVNSTRKEIDLD